MARLLFMSKIPIPTNLTEGAFGLKGFPVDNTVAQGVLDWEKG